MADHANTPGLERTIMNLVETQQKGGVDQTNILLMLSLVNLMGIVNILQQSAGVGLADNPIQQQEVPTSAANGQGDLMQLINQAATGQLDPMQLLSMLGGSGAGKSNNAALLSLLSQMMPPPPPQHKTGQATAQPTNEAPSTEATTKPVENCELEESPQEQERKNGKGFLKWDPRLG